MEINTVPVIYVKAMLDSALRNGCDLATLLEKANIAPEILAADKSRVPAESYSQLSREIIDTLQDETHGFLGSPMRPGTFAMMGYACIHCPTLGQFLQRGLDFYHIVTDSLQLKLTVEDEIAHYALSHQGGASDPNNVMPISMLAIIHRLSSWIIGQNLKLHSVSFTHARPAHANEYNLLFKAPIQFDQPENCLQFSTSYLEMPNTQTEQTLEEFLSIPSLNLMMIPDYQNSLVEKIRLMIKKDVETHFPDLEWVAEQLELSSATLRRRLRTEGTSYQAIKDDIRRDTAIYYLSRGAFSIEQVAEKVGFTEATSFYRAFKRWTGVTPRDYIKK
ncbi:AraC family transcriptional regulator [Maricurvus nonylphenolicus]|uniref:AraC family transcriptional regulator n=1 Tax=Maricurvus nonylphenolicus TaxID=1008307 RepID=UPI0036F20F62